MLSGLDKETFSYDDPEDLMRDMRNYTSRVDLGSPSSDNRTSDDESVRSLLDRIHDVNTLDLHVAPASTESPETRPPGTPSSSGGETSPTPAPGGCASTPAPGEGTPARGRTYESPPSARGRARSTPPARNLRPTAARSGNAPNERTVRELNNLSCFSKGDVPDIAHTDDQFSLVEYAYAGTSTEQQRPSTKGTIKSRYLTPFKKR